MLKGEGIWQAKPGGVCNLVGNNIFTFRETVGRCRHSDSDSKTSLIPKDGIDLDCE